MRAVVLDAGALIALESHDRRMAALVEAIVTYRVPTFVPASVVAQTWRGGPRQHHISRLLKSRALRVMPLDDETARRIGLLLGATGTADVVDAHVADLAAYVGHATVYTSDPSDIRILNPHLTVKRV
ncbi:MAG: PIN domain-containing protein [Cellulomonadaceae bacterium]|nr:PIN domain-containing protein [Cellulomonadaceae bacterium]